MPLFSICVCAWVIGIVLCDAQYPGVAISVSGIVLTVALICRWRSLVWIACCLLAGMLRMTWGMAHMPPPATIPAWYCIDTIQQSWQSQRIVAFDEHNAGIHVDLPVTPTMVVGDCIYLSGTLVPIQSNHDAYRDQLKRRHISQRVMHAQIIQIHHAASWRRALEWWRVASTQRLRTWIREPTATIMAGMLLGVSGDVTATVSTAFKRSGTTHMLVISGWNISIVAWLCVAVTQRFASYRVVRTTLIITCIALYVAAAGASAAVVRAGIMGCVAVIGKALDRPRHALNLIGIATLVMSCTDVSILWDLGFQLSTLATLGLIIFGDTVDAWIAQSALAHASLAWMRESITATLAAHITTLPIMVCRLGVPSPWSILANVIIAPVVPYAMGVGSVVLCIIWVLPIVMPAVQWLVYPPFVWIISGSVIMAMLPAPTLSLVDSLMLECSAHAVWVGIFMYRIRHQLYITLCSNESGIVSSSSYDNKGGSAHA